MMETHHQVEGQIQGVDQPCRHEGGAPGGNCRVRKGKGNLE